MQLFTRCICLFVVIKTDEATKRDFKEKIDELQDELAELRAKIEELEETNKEADSRIIELEGELAAAQDLATESVGLAGGTGDDLQVQYASFVGVLCVWMWGGQEV